MSTFINAIRSCQDAYLRNCEPHMRLLMDQTLFHATLRVAAAAVQRRLVALNNEGRRVNPDIHLTPVARHAMQLLRHVMPPRFCTGLSCRQYVTGVDTVNCKVHESVKIDRLPIFGKHMKYIVDTLPTLQICAVNVGCTGI